MTGASCCRRVTRQHSGLQFVTVAGEGGAQGVCRLSVCAMSRWWRETASASSLLCRQAAPFYWREQGARRQGREPTVRAMESPQIWKATDGINWDLPPAACAGRGAP